MVINAGSVNADVITKNRAQPTCKDDNTINESAKYPEKPLNTFPGSIINDVNKAYCVAVNFLETRLVRKAMLTVPTKPAARLSIPTIIDS